MTKHTVAPNFSAFRTRGCQVNGMRDLPGLAGRLCRPDESIGARMLDRLEAIVEDLRGSK